MHRFDQYTEMLRLSGRPKIIAIGDSWFSDPAGNLLMRIEALSHGPGHEYLIYTQVKPRGRNPRPRRGPLGNQPQIRVSHARHNPADSIEPRRQRLRRQQPAANLETENYRRTVASRT